MKLTAFILALPMALLAGLLLATHSSDEFREILTLLWIISSVICLGWGFYISRKSRLLGWLCVVVGIIWLLLMLWPVYSHGRI